ncbi:MAG: hypothetical protein Q7S78_00510 [Candidatus Azambacteria bacterium]|nr:hypothetical protein [Candidatus Azambacteria bacterium]
MTQNKEIILIITALLFLTLIGGIVFLYSGQEKQNIVSKAELTIDFGDGNKRAFEGGIVANETLVDALNQASRVGNFSYKIDDKNNLSAINNFTSGKDKTWRWYLNDKKIDSLTDGIVLKSNDKILVKYE